jgi:hypothetical protein
MRKLMTSPLIATLGKIAKAVGCLLVLALLCPQPAQAQVWNGSVSDLWGTGANWTPSTVPNSASATATIDSATNNPVLINISPTVGNLSIGSGSSVTLNNGNSLTIAGGTSAGSISNAGTLTQNSSGGFTDMILGGTTGSTITLSGTGNLTLAGNFNNRIYTTTGDSLINNSTIQGVGQVGINNGSANGFALTNNGTIDANVNGSTLQVAPTLAVTNSGTLEATNGGILALTGGTFNNTSTGMISSSGTGSTVNLAGATISGGTLTTATGGAINNNGTATLNGITVGTGSTLTLQNSSTTTLQGAITDNGTIAQSSTGGFTDIKVSGSVTLTGGGSLTMSNNFNNRIYGSGTDTLINDTNNTIQGAGQVGINNGTANAFNLDNKGTIDANVSNTLQIGPTNPVTNSGTLEATAGGTLTLPVTVNNTATGLILASGSGSTVNLNNGTITGGTLTTSSGGVIENTGSATLNGTTNSPTISTGSTLTLANDSSTTLMGTIDNNGTIAQNSTGGFTDVHISGTAAVDGTGVWSMSDNNNNRVYGSGTDTLQNGAGHTIEGSGQFGLGSGGNGFIFTNNGTVLANQSVALTVNPGSTTNNGTFQANSGSTLIVNGTLTNYSATTSTLTGGTYSAISGTIQIGTASEASGHVIATNAATILLDGSTAAITDGAGHDILRTFLATNLAAGSFTIENGANLTTASTGFSNAGSVTIGASSTFTVGGSNDFVQSGTTAITTLVGGGILAVHSGHSVDLDGGTLQGIGTVQGNVNNTGGTIMAGTPGTPGTLNITGNYTDPFGPVMIEQIGPGGHGLLDIGGSASIGGTTLEVDLSPGFTPPDGSSYEIIETGTGVTGLFTDPVIHDGNITFTAEVIGNNVFLNVSGAAVPEPASLILLGMGALGVGALVARRNRLNRGCQSPACK